MREHTFDVWWSLSAILLIGLSGCFKPHGLLLVPIFAISLAGRSWLRTLILGAAGLLPLALSFAPYMMVDRVGFGIVMKPLLAQPSGRLLEMAFANDANGIPVFLLGYLLLLFFLFESQRKDDFGMLHLACWAAMSWFFVTVYFHPQWFVWMCPVAVFGVVHDKRLLKWYVFQMILFSAYTLKWCNIVSEALDQYTGGFIPCLRALSNYEIINGALMALFAAVTLFIPIAFYRRYRSRSMHQEQ